MTVVFCFFSFFRNSNVNLCIANYICLIQQKDTLEVKVNLRLCCACVQILDSLCILKNKPIKSSNIHHWSIRRIRNLSSNQNNPQYRYNSVVNASWILYWKLSLKTLVQYLQWDFIEHLFKYTFATIRGTLSTLI